MKYFILVLLCVLGCSTIPNKPREIEFIVEGSTNVYKTIVGPKLNKRELKRAESAIKLFNYHYKTNFTPDLTVYRWATNLNCCYAATFKSEKLILLNSDYFSDKGAEKSLIRFGQTIFHENLHYQYGLSEGEVQKVLKDILKD